MWTRHHTVQIMRMALATTVNCCPSHLSPSFRVAGNNMMHMMQALHVVRVSCVPVLRRPISSVKRPAAFVTRASVICPSCIVLGSLECMRAARLSSGVQSQASSSAAICAARLACVCTTPAKKDLRVAHLLRQSQACDSPCLFGTLCQAALVNGRRICHLIASLGSIIMDSVILWVVFTI